MNMDDSERRFNKALVLRNEGHIKEALKSLIALEPELAERAGFWLVRGDLEERLAGPRAALTSYRRAVTLAPMHELSSRSLFHALWNLGRAGDVDAEEQAITEIRRFTTLADSESYDKIIAELHEKRDLLWPTEEDEAGDEGENSGDDG